VKRKMLVPLLVAVLLAGSGCGNKSSSSASPTPPSTHSIVVKASGPCSGDTFYHLSAQEVQVRDPGDKLIGAGIMDVTSPVGSTTCSGSVTITSVPEVSTYYVRLVGATTTPAGFNLAGLRAADWTVDVQVIG